MVSGSMSSILQPWQLLFLILSGLVNRRQQEIIEFQNAQIRILMEKMGRKKAPGRPSVPAGTPSSCRCAHTWKE